MFCSCNCRITIIGLQYYSLLYCRYPDWLKQNNLNIHTGKLYVVKCRVVIFYTNGSDFKKDRQLAEEIQILQISPFK